MKIKIVSAALVSLTVISNVHAASIPNYPLFIMSGKPNVLVVLDNSNSMDEAPNGEAAGSNSSASKSEIARTVIRNLTTDYLNRINMGLMAYRLNEPSAFYLHNSPYDVSYNPANYDPGYSGPRASKTKRYRTPNPTDPGRYIYYNIALPFYASSNQGNAFCYSPTADFDNGSETYPNGPWDSYRCFSSKTGTSDGVVSPLPSGGIKSAETALGYSGLFYTGELSPTDSDLAQGILDFGKLLTWNYVGRTWFRNDSPGRGYLHVPIKLLDSTHQTSLLSKLKCNIPGNPAPCSSTGIQNAGLTPIEGTLLTARDYFKGTWNNVSEGYTSSVYPLPNSCGKNFVVMLTDGLPSTDKNGNVVSNPTLALSQAASAANALKADNVETYIVGFALPYGVNPSTLDTIASAGGTGTAYIANDYATLKSAFDIIFLDILKKLGSSSSVSVNSTSISTGTRVFQGIFNSTDWSGDLRAYPVTSSGVSPTAAWEASQHIPAPASRNILVKRPSDGTVVPFEWNSLKTSDQSLLNNSPDVLNYLRGERSKEIQNGGSFRNRALNNVLGDIVHSSPFYVKDTDTVYVGVNDGMLHGFRASDGVELFAFIPKAVFSKLKELTQPNYAHEYFVDGDIAVSNRSDTGGRNYLVALLGHGGKGLFGLDVTNPAGFSTNDVKWEYTDGATDADLGYMLGRPVIAKMNNGQWAAIVGNGYNSTNGRAVLYVFDLATGSVIKKIDTGVGGDNGLATPAVFDADGDGKIDVIYAGDLKGNVWKFDVSHSNTNQWDVAFKSGSTPEPFFTAKDPSGNPQPITAPITVAVDDVAGDTNYGKRFVFFGTGSYFRTSDPSDTQIQSWYGLIDENATISGRSSLMARSVQTEGTVNGYPVRTFAEATAGDMAGKKGWYIDLKTAGGVAQGERIVTESKYYKLAEPTLLASSIIPVVDPCVPGGTGYVNAIHPFTGGSLKLPFFDLNRNADYSDDMLGNKVVGSVDVGVGMPSAPVLVGDELVVGGSSGETKSLKINPGAPPLRGRISWREIILN
ncbi:MAG: type pilus assembly protein PilY1 [Tepidiphilus sp.]|nr:type pilus assembly protein PilY1 [Tepidiphilus sp.]